MAMTGPIFQMAFTSLGLLESLDPLIIRHLVYGCRKERPIAAILKVQ